MPMRVSLAHKLARARTEYSLVRLYAGLDYVTPNDEHGGRGDAIRDARRRGLERARQQRLAYYRRDTTSTEESDQ